MIGVLGATGRVGRHVAAGLALRGVEARALVRRPDPELALPAVQADLSAPATLAATLDGVERLLLLTAHGPDQDLREAAALEAAVAAGVQRIVKISGGAATLGPNGTTPTDVVHWRSEQRVERSGLDFAFLRPSFYMQNLLGTVAPGVAASGALAAPFGHAPIAMVDARDFADCAIAALLDERPSRRAWQLTGPRPVSFDAIAEILGARYVNMPVKLAARTMRRRGLSAAEIDHATRMAAYFASGADSAATDHVLRLTGRAPRSIEALLAEHASAFSPTTRLARALSPAPTKDLIRP
jgi:NAD(P)H dehydrogenase (quinone)